MRIPKESKKFLREDKQFRLGSLLTEQPHPLTCSLGHSNIEKSLRMIANVDKQVFRKFFKYANEGLFENSIKSVANALEKGGNIFFCGCGATGRLSIQLETMWRNFWLKIEKRFPDKYSEICSVYPEIKDRIVSIMAGGDYALIKSVENFEDHCSFGERQLNDSGAAKGDVVFSVTEGGETSFVIGTAWAGLKCGAKVFFVYNNPDEILRSRIKRSRDIIDNKEIVKINVNTGPQALAGSTRMQAATISTLSLGAVLVEAVYCIMSELFNDSELNEFGFKKSNSSLREIAAKSLLLGECLDNSIPDIVKIVEIEKNVYESGENFFLQNDKYPDKGFATYIGLEKSALVILTDTTERAPTFFTPPFSKHGENTPKKSPSYMITPIDDNTDAWQYLLKRPLRAVKWDKNTYRELLRKDDLSNSFNSIPSITEEEILKFKINSREMEHMRPLEEGNFVMVIAVGDDVEEIKIVEKKAFSILEKAKSAGAKTAMLSISSDINDVKTVRADVNLTIKTELEDPFELQNSILLKIILNAFSTVTMAQMGRVHKNFMTYVSPTNKKLIDRATRIILNITGLDYDASNAYLFDVLNYLRPFVERGYQMPSPVHLAVVRINEGLTNSEAVDLLNSGYKINT